MALRVVLPYRAEFGIRVRYHVPRVRALPRPLLVFHEPGLDALYPDCKRILVGRRNDLDRDESDEEFLRRLRRQALREFEVAEVVTIDRASDLPERRFRPEPVRPQVEGEVDVVVAPRWREYGPSKNWDAWPEVSGGLMAERLSVFAGGEEATSYDVPCDDFAWRYGRSLDATIEAMRKARLVVATDAGLAHLAVLVGVPLLLVASSGGLVAPGPVLDGKGKKTFDRYWPIRFDRYYASANWRGVPIEVLPDGWERPDKVVARAVEIARAL